LSRFNAKSKEDKIMHATQSRFLIAGVISLLSSAHCLATPLEILVENAAEPFSRADGTGYANDLVVAAFAAVGIEAKLKVVPYSRCKKMVLDAKAIACFNMAWEPAMAGKIKFPSMPLYTVTPIYFQNKAHPLSAKSEAELSVGLKIGVVSGYEYPPIASQLPKRGIIFVQGQNEQINLKQLALGSINAALVMASEIQTPQYWADTNNLESNVII
jgi:hypothetical protein